jgi:hypothetical protein
MPAGIRDRNRNLVSQRERAGAHGGDQFDRREGGVSDDDDQPVRQPALDLENALAGPVCEMRNVPPGIKTMPDVGASSPDM